MKNNASYDRVIEKAESMDVLASEQSAQLEQNNVAVLELDDNNVNRIEKINGVVSLENDIILTANEEAPIDEEEVNALIEQNAELPFVQWNLDAINLPDSLSLTGDNVKVAVLDSGITAAEDVLVADYIDLTGSNNENPFFNDSTGHGNRSRNYHGSSRRQLQSYVLNAGFKDNVSKISTSVYCVDKIKGDVSSNKNDYTVDYNYFLECCF